MKPIRIIAIVVALLVLATAPAFAEPPAPAKEEVVYAHLGSDGAVNQAYVVNAFPDSNGKIVDHGDYGQIINLTNTEQINYNGQRLDINTEPGNFYYQGELTSRAMPWQIAVGYELDGEKLPASELVGRSGQLRINIAVRQDRSIDPVYFDNYLLQVSVNLDAKYCSDIVSAGATIAANGEVKVVNHSLLPGKEADYTITATVRNLHLGQIQAVGLPFEMVMDMPDPSSYLGDLLALQQAIAQLADGVNQFGAGVDQLDRAAGQLGSGAEALTSNAHTIAAGFDRLAAGRGDFDAGLRQYNQAIQQFATGLTALPTGLASFTAGIDQLTAGSGQLAGGLAGVGTGMGQFDAALGQTANGSVALSAGIDQLSAGLGELTAQGKYADPNLVGGSAQILAALSAIDQALSLPLSDAEAQQLLGLLQTFSSSFQEFSKSVEATDFDTFLTRLRDALTRFDGTVGRIEQIAADLQDGAAITARLGIDVTDNPQAQALLAEMAEQGRRLDAATVELRAIRAELGGLEPLLAGVIDSLNQLRGQFEIIQALIARLNTAIQTITGDDINKLKAGIKLLSSNYRTFHQGLVAYVDGVEQAYLGVSGEQGLAAGAHELSSGLGQLAASSSGLTAGVVQLAGGAAQLHSGLRELQAGANQFASQAGQLSTGAGQLATGGNELVAGHTQLLAGDGQYATGIHQYASGMSSYSTGVQQYVVGMGELNSAAGRLGVGANELRAGTSNMDQQLTQRMNEAMAEFLPGDYTSVSFTSPKNTGIQRVQFVYLLDAQIEPTVQHTSEPEPQKSWWQRIIDIFRGGD